MPYNIRQRGNKWEVYSPHGVKGTHDTYEEARAQQKAIYANTEDTTEESILKAPVFHNRYQSPTQSKFFLALDAKLRMVCEAEEDEQTIADIGQNIVPSAQPATEPLTFFGQHITVGGHPPREGEPHLNHNGMVYGVSAPVHGIRALIGKRGLAGYLIEKEAVTQFKPQNMAKFWIKEIKDPAEIQRQMQTAPLYIDQLLTAVDPGEKETAKVELKKMDGVIYDLLAQKIAGLQQKLNSLLSQRQVVTPGQSQATISKTAEKPAMGSSEITPKTPEELQKEQEASMAAFKQNLGKIRPESIFKSVALTEAMPPRFKRSEMSRYGVDVETTKQIQVLETQIEDLQEVIRSFQGIDGLYRIYRTVLAGTAEEAPLAKIYDIFRKKVTQILNQAKLRSQEPVRSGVDQRQKAKNDKETTDLALADAAHETNSEMAKIMEKVKDTVLNPRQKKAAGGQVKSLADVWIDPAILPAIAAAANDVEPVVLTEPIVKTPEPSSLADVQVPPEEIRAAKGPSYREYPKEAKPEAEYIPVIFDIGWTKSMAKEKGESAGGKVSEPQEPVGWVVTFDKTEPKMKVRDEGDIYKIDYNYDYFFPAHAWETPANKMNTLLINYKGGQREVPEPLAIAYKVAKQYGDLGSYTPNIRFVKSQPQNAITIGTNEYKELMRSVTDVPVPKKERSKKPKITPIGSQATADILSPFLEPTDIDISGLEEPSILKSKPEPETPAAPPAPPPKKAKAKWKANRELE